MYKFVFTKKMRMEFTIENFMPVETTDLATADPVEEPAEIQVFHYRAYCRIQKR
jgi:hypothetical protein